MTLKEEPEGAEPKVGAYILESLTTGMYTNPLDALRELVQNSADAIRKAEETKILSPRGGRVVVEIDTKSRSLVVRDNGIGVPKDKVRETLQNIGMSCKQIGIDAGFRGIGRLAAIAYCKKIVYRTSFAGEATVTTLTLDCAGIRTSCAPASRQVGELAKVLLSHTKVAQEAHKKDDHFFEVEMEGIDPSTGEFLDMDTLKTYLAQVAPVEFDSQSFIYAPILHAWMKQHGLEVHTISLTLKLGKTEHQVFKPYKGRYKTLKTRAGGDAFDIKGIGFFPPDPGPNPPFWLWYGESDFLGSIDDPHSAGFRIRKHNISIGDAEGASKIFVETAESNERFNNYFIGEIHVCAEDMIPNSRRDGFEDGALWQAIKEELKKFFTEKVKLIRKASENRNKPVQKLAKTTKAILDESNKRLDKGFSSEKQKTAHIEGLRKEQKKLQEAQHSEREADAAAKIRELRNGIDAALSNIENKSKYSAQNLDPCLDRKQRKVIQEILEILHAVLDNCAFIKAESALLERFGARPQEKKK